MVAAALADFITYSSSPRPRRSTFRPRSSSRDSGSGRVPNDFDLYVPALLALAIIMIMFTAAACDQGGRQGDDRPPGPVPAQSLGIPGRDRPDPSLDRDVRPGPDVSFGPLRRLSDRRLDRAFLTRRSATTVSVVAISLIVAGWMKTIYELLTVGVFPFFVLMFFREHVPASENPPLEFRNPGVLCQRRPADGSGGQSLQQDLELPGGIAPISDLK